MRFTSTMVLRIEKGKIVEELGLDDGVTALQQLDGPESRVTEVDRAGERSTRLGLPVSRR